MLQLVLGVSGTGKSTYIFEEIRRRARQGQYSILMVPEQFTSSTESRIYHWLGDELSGYVASYSFTSLSEKLLGLYGGAAIRTVTDATRVVMVRRAIEALGDGVRYYTKHRRNPAFLQLCAETLNELKSAGLTGQQLEQLARAAGQEKLLELASIFSAYEAVLGNTSMDPADRVELSARKAQEHPEFFADRAVYLDEFDTFDSPKQKLLRAILPAAESVTVTLCADGEEDWEAGLGLFSGAKQVAARLRRLARSVGCPVAATQILEEDHRHAPALARAAALLAGQEPEGPAPEPDGSITLYRASDRAQEVKATAAAIQKLARQGASYRDMAVICRQSDEYLRLVRGEFRQAGIPLYQDEATTAEFSPPALLARALLQLLRGGLTSDRVLAAAKTGLCGLSQAQLSALENYAFTWKLRAEDWRAPFTRNPSGFGSREMTRSEAAQLELAETARARLIGPIQEFLRQAKDQDATQLTRLLYQTMDGFGAGQATFALSRQLEEEGQVAQAAETRRLWNVVVRLMDQMTLLLGTEKLEAAEYDELFTLLLRSQELEHVPQTLDAVIFTSAGKMRLDSPAHCLVLGLGEGEFPRTPQETGLLTHADRELLMEQTAGAKPEEQLFLPDRFENRVLREKMAFYKALTAPSRTLWLSWAEGSAGLPLTSGLDVLSPENLPAPELEESDLALTPAMALDRLGALWEEDTPRRAALWQALREQGGDLPGKMEQISRGEEYQVEDREALGRLLGRELKISASQLKTFAQCPFAYYMQYVLRAKPRQKAILDPAQSGTLVHFVLEKALQEPDFLALNEKELEALAQRLTQQYMKENLDSPDPQLLYLASRLARSFRGLLLFLQQEQRQGGFAPVAFELEIGQGEGKVPPRSQSLPGGVTVQAVGKIDRVDLYLPPEENAAWVRVMDYKTGTQTFALEDVLSGIDCQMLLYLFTLTAQWHPAPGLGLKPAGVQYLLTDPAPQTLSREKARQSGQGPGYTVDGLVCADQDVQRAMDAELAGEYMPTGYYKNGEPKKPGKIAGEEKLRNIEEYLDRLLAGMARRLCDGRVPARPLQDEKGENKCAWCPYRPVCGHLDGENERPRPQGEHLFEESEEVVWDR